MTFVAYYILGSLVLDQAMCAILFLIMKVNFAYFQRLLKCVDYIPCSLILEKDEVYRQFRTVPERNLVQSEGSALQLHRR